MVDVLVRTWRCRVCGDEFQATLPTNRINMKCSRCHRQAVNIAVTSSDPEPVSLANCLRMPQADPTASERNMVVPPSNTDQGVVDRLNVLVAEAYARIKAELASAENSGPDPTAATTVREFVDAMRRLVVWAGDPPLRDLSKRAGVGRLPKSTLHDALNRDTLPKLGLVMELVRVCGAADARPAWIKSWKRLRASLPGEDLTSAPGGISGLGRAR